MPTFITKPPTLMKHGLLNISIRSAMVLGLLLLAGCQSQKPAESSGSTPGFNGTIALDVRDSKPDWAPFTPKQAPKGAPNILFVLYDDTGQAA